ncbi:universal stress protein [Streptomyces sp900116325]|uniref:universal stress protein n=1 Tax=Streptomyces sp. 900116325 TaxID=3154295 RepID=UPI00332C7739
MSRLGVAVLLKFYAQYGFASLLLGSVSQQCAVHASCPVVIVRPDATGDDEATDRAWPAPLPGS